MSKISKGWTSGCVFKQFMNKCFCMYMCRHIFLCAQQSTCIVTDLQTWIFSFTYVCRSTMALTIPIISRKFPFSTKPKLQYCAGSKHLLGTCVATLITNICSNPAPIRESLLHQTFITMGLMTHFRGSLCMGKWNRWYPFYPTSLLKQSIRQEAS